MPKTNTRRRRDRDKQQMGPREILNYCLEKPGAWLDHPFGPIPHCVKVGRRLFAQLYPRPKDYKLTLNCQRDRAELYRRLYPGVVVPGYHCPSFQQPYFNTVWLNGAVAGDDLRAMIDHSYEYVLHKHTRREQAAILSGEWTGGPAPWERKGEPEHDQNGPV